jgi:hypothetical protein
MICHKNALLSKKQVFFTNKQHALRYKNKIITREASNKQGDKESICVNA